MRALRARAEAAAIAQRQRRMQRIIAALQEQSGVRAEIEGPGVTMSGVSLVRRWLSDPALRFAARLS